VDQLAVRSAKTDRGVFSWFLDEPMKDWKPPPSLLSFIAAAKADGVPIVYIGFGSIVVADPVALTENIYAAVQAAGVRAIVSEGWSGRMENEEMKRKREALVVPKEVYVSVTVSIACLTDH
jgi:sterol 3beta-glucosyltransferase